LGANCKTIPLFSNCMWWNPSMIIGPPTFHSAIISIFISGSAIHCFIKSGYVNAVHTAEEGALITTVLSIRCVILCGSHERSDWTFPHRTQVHSSRSGSIGSTRIAPMAGAKVAMNAMQASVAIAVATVGTVAPLIP
jgi:hypothetical protein